MAFWLTTVEERKEIPFVDGMPELGVQTQIVWKEEFVSGIETPILGFMASLVFLAILFFRRQGV